MISCLFALLAQPPAPAVGPANFEEVVALLQPKPGEEEWTKVGWRASLWAAVEESAAQDKPVLLWVMNGHPGGCT